MYAVIETGGKQYKVQNGDVIFVEKLDVEAEAKLTFDKVIAFKDRTLKVGTPYVKDAKVEATVIKNGKGKKITVFTYRPKKGSKRCLGHRQPYTQIRIDSMGIEKATKAAAADAE